MIGEWWEIITPSERWIGKVESITATTVTVAPGARYWSRLTEGVRDLGRETFVVQPKTFTLADVSYTVLEGP